VVGQLLERGTVAVQSPDVREKAAPGAAVGVAGAEDGVGVGLIPQLHRDLVVRAQLPVGSVATGAVRGEADGGAEVVHGHIEVVD
jgi:hypothetical protein